MTEKKTAGAQEVQEYSFDLDAYLIEHSRGDVPQEEFERLFNDGKRKIDSIVKEHLDNATEEAKSDAEAFIADLTRKLKVFCDSEQMRLIVDAYINYDRSGGSKTLKIKEGTSADLLTNMLCVRFFEMWKMQEAGKPDPYKDIPNPTESLALAYAPISARVKHHFMTLTKASAVLHEGDIINDRDGVDLEVIRKPAITTFISAEFEEGAIGGQIAKAANLSAYDMNVSNAVFSLFEEARRLNKKPVFTLNAIHKAMPSGGNDNPSPQQKASITKSIEKLRRLHVTMDASEEFRRRKVIDPDTGEPIDHWDRDENYFMAARERRRSGKTETITYHFAKQPLMLEYAKLTGQCTMVSMEYFDVKKLKGGKISTEPIPITEARGSMLSYMAMRIRVMQRDKKNKAPKQSNTILFATLFSHADITTTDRKQIADYKKFCFAALDYWVAKKYIKGYRKQTKGRSVTGIEIDL